MSTALQKLQVAAAANGYQVNVHIRDLQLIFSLVDDGRGRVKKTIEFDSAESALDFLNKRTARYVDFLDSLPNGAVANAPDIDNFENDKPVLDEVGYSVHRSLPMTLGQHLDEILTDRILKGVTRFTVFSSSYWRELAPGERDSFDINFSASTERMEPQHAIELHIAASVTRAVAIAALMGICAELEDMDSLEKFTPKEPEPTACDPEEIPF